MRSWWVMLTGSVVSAMAVVSAGGWAVITVTRLPRAAVVGTPLELPFAVRVHGMRLTDGLQPRVEAVAGEEQLEARVRPSRETGHYTATLTFPHPGLWTVVIYSGHGMNPKNATWISIPALESGDAPPRYSPAEWGEKLFTAKGCVTCHRHGEVQTQSAQSATGPTLGRKVYDVERLLRILTNPRAADVSRRYGEMPALGLDEHEIASLVAFLNRPVSQAARE